MSKQEGSDRTIVILFWVIACFITLNAFASLWRVFTHDTIPEWLIKFGWI